MAMEWSYSILKRIGQMEICCTGLLIIDSLNFLNTNIVKMIKFFSQKKKKNDQFCSNLARNCKKTPQSLGQLQIDPNTINFVLLNYEV